MKRREFFVKSIGLGGGFAFTRGLKAGRPEAVTSKSRVVISRDSKMHVRQNSISTIRLQNALNSAVSSLFNKDNPRKAWQRAVRPGEVIGIKVNCLSGRGTTHIELVDAVVENLRQAGIKEKDIIIWDRLNRDLEEAGFKINYQGKGVRCFGNDAVGFESSLETFGSAGSLVSKIPARMCHGIINLPVLKDHSIAGVTVSLKNMFGAIHNPNKYHLNSGDPYIADVNMLPSLQNKIRLNICDAIEAQYHGGPSFMPQWRWNFNGLIASIDRPALDYTGWQIIEEQRKKAGFKLLKEEGREPAYIATAADARHQLGTNNSDNIEVVKLYN